MPLNLMPGRTFPDPRSRNLRRAFQPRRPSPTNFHTGPAPYVVVPVTRPHDRVRNLVKNRVPYCGFGAGFGERARERDFRVREVCGAGAAFGAVEFERPLRQPVLVHEPPPHPVSIVKIHGSLV